MKIFTDSNNKVQHNNPGTINAGNDFDKFVLQKTDGSQFDRHFNQLLNKVKELSPEPPCASYSPNSLQNDSDNTSFSEADYATESTEKNNARSLCLNMLSNTMLNKFFHQDDEDNDFI